MLSVSLPMSPLFQPVIRKCTSFEEMRNLAVGDWQKLPAELRAAAAWDMVREAWLLQNRNPDELRLQRIITVVRKA